MGRSIKLVRDERRAGLFMAGRVQSTVETCAPYVGVLLVAAFAVLALIVTPVVGTQG